MRWNGASFSLVGGSLQPSQFGSSRVMTMTIFDDDGPGPRPPALYVGGSFETAGGLFVQNIARWDGSNWESLGIGANAIVQALAVFDADGDGPELPMLYAGGQFSHTNGQVTRRLARWDGSQWSEVPGYNGGGVESLYVFDDDGDGPNKPALYVGGLGFYWAGTVWSPGLARWGCARSTCYADCDASTGFGTLDLFDFLCFQNAFVTADPYACDCDTSTGPATCDVLDFLCFQRAFMAGCR